MAVIGTVRRAGATALVLGVLALGQAGCGSPQENIALGAVGTTILGGQAPTNEIEQIYYMGVFDPQDQLPPTVYRVRVHGQASFISFTKFASGWVRADLLDSLGTGISFDNGKVKIEKGDGDELSAIDTGRRLIMFGPEGFREAPKDHRLVIVMGSSPEKFFQAIDQSLEAFAEAQAGQTSAALDRKLFDALAHLKAERENLDDLEGKLQELDKEIEDLGS